MLAVSSAGWTGMSFIEDISAGIMDRLLVVLVLLCAAFATRAFGNYQRSL